MKLLSNDKFHIFKKINKIIDMMNKINLKSLWIFNNFSIKTLMCNKDSSCSRMIIIFIKNLISLFI
jgi:hypothetical protein